jgi:hypothetical protein
LFIAKNMKYNPELTRWGKALVLRCALEAGRIIIAI